MEDSISANIIEARSMDLVTDRQNFRFITQKSKHNHLKRIVSRMSLSLADIESSETPRTPDVPRTPAEAIARFISPN